ncbi:hypothetical protein IPJ72_04685 [Candidatus Peregrinibacteria bacterium]|nr:MAG: hypothetical protein IPJ72_04685 [Candidatus Peregrinibacteria bacterium]
MELATAHPQPTPFKRGEVGGVFGIFENVMWSTLMKKYLKIVLGTILVTALLSVMLFFLAWSGIFGKKYYHLSNDLIGQYFYSALHLEREVDSVLTSHKNDCIGNCKLEGDEVSKLGMLHIRKGTDICVGLCRENTKYKIAELEVEEDGKYTNKITILGIKELPEEYSELMVRMYGSIKRGAIQDFNVYDLMYVTGFEVFSKVPYHSFLRDEKTRYTQEKYGCNIYWNATFGWEYSNEQPIIKVRMTSDPPNGEHPGKFIELFYDGNTAEFIKEENNFGLLFDPCNVPN